LLDWVRPLVEIGPAGEVNESLMELGATVCTPAAPRCDECPLAAGCLGHASGRPADFPEPRATRNAETVHWVAACCVDDRGRWLLQSVDDGPILRGLWLPPIAALGPGDDPVERAVDLAPAAPIETPEVLSEVRHSITHRRITVTPVRMTVDAAVVNDDRYRWISPGEETVATSSLLAKLIDRNNLEA
jgi:A/G-specific adenine glycosylase